MSNQCWPRVFAVWDDYHKQWSCPCIQSIIQFVYAISIHIKQLYSPDEWKKKDTRDGSGGNLRPRVVVANSVNMAAYLGSFSTNTYSLGFDMSKNEVHLKYITNSHLESFCPWLSSAEIFRTITCFPLKYKLVTNSMYNVKLFKNRVDTYITIYSIAKSMTKRLDINICRI